MLIVNLLLRKCTLLPGLQERNESVPDQASVQEHFHRGFVGCPGESQWKTCQQNDEHLDCSDGIPSSQGGCLSDIHGF